jgi:hypothetical protein
MFAKKRVTRRFGENLPNILKRNQNNSRVKDGQISASKLNSKVKNIYIKTTFET